MKRIVVALAAVALLAAGSVALVAAQTPTPENPGQGWGCGGYGTGAGGTFDPSKNVTLQRLADKIGISAADLYKELQDGKSVMDVAGARNVSKDTLVEVLLAPQADMVGLMVEYGYLTQEQADASVEYAATRTRELLEQKGYFGFGMMGGYGGMMGGGYGGMMGAGPGGMMGGGYGGMMGGGFRGTARTQSYSY